MGTKHCGKLSPEGAFYCTERERGHPGEHRAGIVNEETGEIEIAWTWDGDAPSWWKRDW